MLEILKQPLHTAVTMETVEFEEFSVEEALHITISLKDFKVRPVHVCDLLTMILIDRLGNNTSCDFA